MQQHNALTKGFTVMLLIIYAPGSSEMRATELEPLHTEQGLCRILSKTRQQMEQVSCKH